MSKNTFPPVVLIAIAAVVSFYSLYLLTRVGIQISSWMFLITAGLIILVITGKMINRIAQWMKPHLGVVKQKQHCRYWQKVGVLLCISFGTAAGSYGELSLRKAQRPPQTLPPFTTINSIVGELCSEPVPAGKQYYCLPVRLLGCSTSDYALYSASGVIRLFLPASVVRSVYAGEITRIVHTPPTIQACQRSVIETAAVRMFNQENEYSTAAHLLDKATKAPQACRFYVQGLRLLVRGRFDQSGTLFFAYTEQPLFLGWRDSLSRIRAFFRFYFVRLLYNWGEAGGLLLALLAADKAFLSPTCIEYFHNAGLAHILALSGMHLSLIGTAALQGGALFGHKKYAVRLSLLSVCFFVWFAGSAPSLNRALGMFMIAAAGDALGVRPSLSAVLCSMLIIHIGFMSTEALTLGFMLSYGACAGIFIFGEACARLFTGSIPARAVQSISASIGAQLFTTPIVITTVGTIATAGIIASCLISPLVSLFLVFGLICIPFVALIPPLGTIAGYGLHILYSMIFHTAAFFSRFPVIKADNEINRLFISIVAVIAGIVMTVTARNVGKRLPRLI